jgi:membrane fusion protein (multidrug efflux system)
MVRKLIFNFLLGLTTILLGIWGFNKLSSMKKARPEVVRDPMISAFVDTVELKDETIYIQSNGTLQAKNQIDLTSKVQGIFEMSTKNFKEGVMYRKGELIIGIDDNDVLVSMQTQKSQLQKALIAMLADLKFDFPKAYEKWKAYAENFEIEGILKDLPEPDNDREKSFISLKDIYTLFYTAKATENNLRHYRIYAPFTGVLTEVNSNPGAMITPGQTLGKFISNDIFELEVKLPLNTMDLIKVGEPVLLNDLHNTGNWNGKVTRIQSKVDPGSQSFLIVIELKGEGLISGMYLQANIKTTTINQVYDLSRPLLMNQKEIFVVKDSVLSLENIQPIYYKEKSVLIRGVSDGDVLLRRPVPGAFDGMKVHVLEE